MIYLLAKKIGGRPNLWWWTWAYGTSMCFLHIRWVCHISTKHCALLLVI